MTHATKVLCDLSIKHIRYSSPATLVERRSHRADFCHAEDERLGGGVVALGDASQRGPLAPVQLAVIPEPQLTYQLLHRQASVDGSRG